jgi:hypothetical protein
MVDAGHAAVHGLPDRNRPDRPVYNQVHDAVFPVGGPGYRPFDVHGLAAVSDIALAHLEPGSVTS